MAAVTFQQLLMQTSEDDFQEGLQVGLLPTQSPPARAAFGVRFVVLDGLLRQPAVDDVMLLPVPCGARLNRAAEPRCLAEEGVQHSAAEH